MKNIKKIFLLISFILCVASCNQGNQLKKTEQKDSPTIDKVTITIDGDNLAKGNGETLKVDKNTSWAIVKTDSKISGITFNIGYEAGVWKLGNRTGATLEDNHKFETNTTIFITSILKTNNQITITIRGNNLKDGEGSTFQIEKNRTWETVKKSSQVSNVKFNDGYILDNWHLNNESGKKLHNAYKFETNTTIFATSMQDNSSIFRTTGAGGIDGYNVDMDKLPENLIIPSVIKGEVINGIDGNAFKDCTKIKKLDISRCNSFESISDSAFEGCTNLKEIIFPESIEAIGINAFKGCKNLGNLDFSICKRLESLSGFASCEGLTSLDLSSCSNLKHIALDAFKECKNLTGEVKMPLSLENIEGNAFYGASKLAKIDLSNTSTFKEIRDKAFYGATSLVITLPLSIKKLGEKAFGEVENGNDHRCKKVRILNGAEGDKVKDLVIDAPCLYTEDHIERF
ncbi:MAG: leucine-rich repeat domain-containing protein [Treponema sp.]